MRSNQFRLLGQMANWEEEISIWAKALKHYIILIIIIEYVITISWNKGGSIKKDERGYEVWLSICDVLVH